MCHELGLLRKVVGVRKITTHGLKGTRLLIVNGSFLSPRATPKKRFRTSIEIDMFKMIDQALGTSPGGGEGNPRGTFPSNNGGLCGPTFPSPGSMPPVEPPKQFYTQSPGQIAVIVLSCEPCLLEIFQRAGKNVWCQQNFHSGSLSCKGK